VIKEPDSLADFTTFPFASGGAERVVYRKGSGPAVVVMHEIPGIAPEVARFARYVAEAGFTVFMPHLFGTPGKPASTAYVATEMARACISREFRVLAENRASPITDWMRALAKRAYDEIGGRGVGAIGMCLTGNFALTMTLDPWVVAPVLSQPSLPFAITARKAAALHATPEALANARRRAAEEGLTIVGLRFEGDRACRRERFDSLTRELGAAFERIELPDSAANPDAPKLGGKPHNVLTLHLIDRAGEPTRAALDRVIGFFKERLQ
jgi:dienelactone hydrolase